MRIAAIQHDIVWEDREANFAHLAPQITAAAAAGARLAVLTETFSTGFGRDVYLQGEMALRKDGKILGVRMHTISDHGAFYADAQPTKFKM